MKMGSVGVNSFLDIYNRLQLLLERQSQVFLKPVILASVGLFFSFNVNAQNTTIAVPSGENSVGNISTKTKRSVETSHLKLTAGMSSKFTNDYFNRTTIGGGYFEATGEREFNKYLSGFFTTGAYFASGNGASLYGTDATSYQYFAISRASFVIKPIEFFDVEAGILGRNFTTLPAAFAADGFLGVSESINIGKTDETHLTFQARQQTLSSDADKNLPSKQNNPTLTMIGADSLLKTKYSSFGISAHFFNFSQLPAAVANNAVFLNDTTLAIKGSPNNSFAYDFRGIQFGGVARIDLNKRVDLGFKGGFVRNSAAAPGTGTGYSLAAGSKIRISNDIILEPEIGYYYNERNVLPAPYVSNSLGNVNRKAYIARAGLKFPKEDLEVFSSFVRAIELYDWPTSADRSIFTLGVEAAYDIL